MSVVGSSSDGSLADISDAAQLAAATASGKVSVIYFTAPWCQNCRKITTAVSNLPSQYPNISFFKVNTAQAEVLGQENNIDVLPTFVFFRAGSRIGEYKGSNLEQLIPILKGF